MNQNLNMDPRMVREIQSSPTMMGEQGQGFLAEHGGPQGYIALTELGENEKAVYFSIKGGMSSVNDIQIDTDLPVAEINAAVGVLKGKGLVSASEVTKASGL